MIVYPAPALQRNDKKARTLILIFSAIIFLAVMALSRVKLNVNLGFDVHLFAFANSVINSIVSVLLIIALIAVKAKQYLLHKKIMLVAMVLSVLFLVSYICHHLFAGEARFGDVNHDGLVTNEEKAAVGNMRMLYYILLGTHIPLAGIILPFILFTAYRGLIAEWPQHKKLARITWPVWLYVAVTGVVVYWMIKPYYD
jgi:putative membrane protein